MELSLALFLTVIVIVFLKLVFSGETRNCLALGKPQSKQPVPIVPWALPIFGHGLWVTLKPREFFQYCYSHYGDIFKIQMFSSAVVVVCNKTLVTEISKSAETQLSFYKHLEKIFVGDENGLSMSLRASVIKKATVRMGNLEMASEMQKRATQFLEALSKDCSTVGKTLNVDLKDKINRFVIKTTSICLLGVEFSEDMIQEFKEFAVLQNVAALATRAIPLWLARFLFATKLTRDKPAIWKEFKKQITIYRNNQSLTDSPILRAASVAINDKTGLPLEDGEICFLLISLLFASTSNTTLCILHTVLELSKCPKFLNTVAHDAEECLNSGNTLSILNSNYLNSCILEAARMNTNIILVERTPDQKEYLGDYYIGDCDSVAIAGTLNHVDGTAGSVFPSPNEYNPERYLENEKIQGFNMSWGAGVHACSGRLFAIAMTKVLVANFVNVYKIDMEKTFVSKPNFKCHAAFVDVQVSAVIEKRKKETKW